MKKTLLGSFCFLAVSGLFPCSLFAISWTPPKVSTYILPNGFQIYLLENHELPIVEAKLFVKVGSAYEEGRLAGLADVVADLLAGGGTLDKTPEALDLWLDEKSIQLRGDAGRELTTITAASLSKQLDSLLAILQEAVTKPRFDEDRFRLIIGQTKEGLRREEDAPHVVAAHAFNEAVYGKDHPWGRRPTVKSVSDIRLKEVRQFYETHFHPNRMLLAVAGDFSKEKVRQWAAKNFGPLKPKEVPQPEWKKVAIGGKGATTIIKRKVTQAFIEAGHSGLVRLSKEEYAYAVMQYILGGEPFISRLGLDIRSQSGLAYSVYTDWDANPVGGIFSIQVQTKADAKQAVLEKIDTHLKRFSNNGDITPGELALAKESLLNKYIFSFDSPFKVIFQQASFDLLGYPKDYLRKYPEAIRKVTLKEVQDVAKKYIRPENLKIVIVEP